MHLLYYGTHHPCLLLSIPPRNLENTADAQCGDTCDIRILNLSANITRIRPSVGEAFINLPKCMICGFAYGISGAVRAISVPSTWKETVGGEVHAAICGVQIFVIRRMPQEFLNSIRALTL